MQLIALDGSNSLAYVLLGRLLQEGGRFDEATTSFERAIALDPWQTSAYHGLVSSMRLTEAERSWVDRIVTRLAAKRLAPEVCDRLIAEQHRMMLHFAAGKGMDDLGDYADALSHFHAANGIRRRLFPFDRKEIEHRTAQLIARFTPEFFSRHSALGHDDETPVLIIGLPRSGTTLLERVVSSHPEVRGCGELTFWSERGPAWSPRRARTGLPARPLTSADGYLRALRRDAPRAPSRATDKMPFNFFWVGLVHLLFPKARFVHARRSPVDTCLSLYTTPLTARWGFASEPGDLAWYYRQYVRLVDHWRADHSIGPPGSTSD